MSHPVLCVPAQPVHLENHFQGKTILSRHEAKGRLKSLTPGTDEYLKLQAALIRTAGIVEISLPRVSYKVDTSTQGSTLLGGFGSSEHISIGEGVRLQGLPDNTPLLLKGPNQIYFQHIIALAGDFYGVAGEAISLKGGTDEEKTGRFIKAFNTLWEADNTQIRKIMAELNKEYASVKHAGLPHHCYSNQLIGANTTIKKIKPDIDDLLVDNSDHFSKDAKEAYRIGHAYALKMAQEAGNDRDLEKLKHAYALEAFACHFFTDLFAAGHIRNQRGELELFLVSQLGFPSAWAKKLAGLLTGAQHEKDGQDGLNVSNGKGDSWRAYGDGYFFTPKNEENRKRAKFALQCSADEIYRAYAGPGSPLVSHTEQLILHDATFDSQAIVGQTEQLILQDATFNPLASEMEQLIPRATTFNPPPIYSLEGTSLFLHQGSRKIEITSKTDYLLKAIPEAQKYLPESYINGFIDSYVTDLIKNKLIDIQTPEVVKNAKVALDKVIVPRIERLTGSIWQVLGVAAYHQLKHHSQQLNEKINELGDIGQETFNKSSKILEELEKISAELNQFTSTHSLQEIRESIAIIKDRAHEYEHFGSTLDTKQLDRATESLWDAFLRLSRVFCSKTIDNKDLLEVYASMLSRRMLNGKLLSKLQVEIGVTYWFRQMLDYQIQAFWLYGTLKILRNSEQQEQIRLQTLDFEELIEKQLEVNKNHLAKNLICESQTYIALKSEKEKTKQAALDFLAFN